MRFVLVASFFTPSSRCPSLVVPYGRLGVSNESPAPPVAVHVLSFFARWGQQYNINNTSSIARRLTLNAAYSHHRTPQHTIHTKCALRKRNTNIWTLSTFEEFFKTPHRVLIKHLHHVEVVAIVPYLDFWPSTPGTTSRQKKAKVLSLFILR